MIRSTYARPDPLFLLRIDLMLADMKMPRGDRLRLLQTLMRIGFR